MKNGRAGTMTHDYQRHGVTTCSRPSMSLRARSSANACMKRHRHQEFIRFLNVIDTRAPKEKDDPCHLR
jgi:hypothetical protein